MTTECDNRSTVLRECVCVDAGSIQQTDTDTLSIAVIEFLQKADRDRVEMLRMLGLLTRRIII